MSATVLLLRRQVLLALYKRAVHSKLRSPQIAALLITLLL